MLLSNIGKSERYNMASKYLLNRYQRTLRPKAKTLLDRVKIESKLSREMHDANMGVIGDVAKLAMTGGETLRDYKLSKAGGFEGNLFNFIGNPEQAGEFKAKGADLAKIYGRERVLGGDVYMKDGQTIVGGLPVDVKPEALVEANNTTIVSGLQPEVPDTQTQTDYSGQSSVGGVHSIGELLMRKNQRLGSY